MSLEFELPLVSFIFLMLLNFVYFLKPRIKLQENKYFEIILISSLIAVIINTFIHVICATHDFSVLNTTYYELFNSLNRVLSLLFVIIFASLFMYTVIISYENIRKKEIKLQIPVLITLGIIFIMLLSTDVRLIQIGSVTNVEGPTADLGFLFVAIFLLFSLVVTIMNYKRIDKRYFSIIFIIAILTTFYFLIYFFPALLLYDLGLALLCYVMYFTIENPDMKIIKQLNIAKDTAEKANMAKSDFLSSMSHEIRTPLNAIVGFSSFIMETDDLDEAKENAKDVVLASGTLLEIVNGILDISKIEAGKMEIVNSNYNTQKLLDSIVRLVQGRIGDKPIKLNTTIAKDLPNSLFGDHANIKKILINILTNAVKYTDEGEINFTINCINTKGVCRLMISIEDTGRGIRKDQIGKLFTKFQRLDEDRNTTIEGTGLGLAITKQLIELMGGTIVVHSNYGKGSKFTVAINQLIALKDVDTEKANEIEVKEYFNKNVLIVDDNNLNLKVASKILQPYKLNIVTCSSGEESIKLINEQKFDLILMDDMMPRMSGTETLEKLKEDKTFNIPVIALTANAINGMREKYLKLGFDDYLSKPIDREELNKVLNNFLNTRNN